MRTGRPKQRLILTDEEHDRLESLAHRARSQPALARRARVLLACAEGLDNKTLSRWGRTRPSREGFSRQKWDPSWRCHRSADCTTVTNDGSPETYQPKLSCAHRRVSFLWSGGAGTDGKNC